MEAFWSRNELHKAIGCVYLEDAALIGAVICDPEFLAEMMERERTLAIPSELKYTGVSPKSASLVVVIDPLLQCTLMGVLAGRMLSTRSGLVKRSIVNWLSKRTKSEETVAQRGG